MTSRKVGAAVGILGAHLGGSGIKGLKGELLSSAHGSFDGAQNMASPFMPLGKRWGLEEFA